MKDYAKYSQKHAPGPFYKALLILAVLVSIGGLIYLAKDLLSSTQLTEKLSTAKKSVSEKVAHPAPKKTAPTPAPKTKVVDNTPPKPKFDFYTLLPQMKMSSAGEENPALQTRPNSNTKASGPESFVLQIASVQNAAAAAELVGRLNLLGVETQIQPFQKNGKTWIRILSKPYSNYEAAAKTQERLHQHHIESLLVKMR